MSDTFKLKKQNDDKGEISQEDNEKGGDERDDSSRRTTPELAITDSEPNPQIQSDLSADNNEDGDIKEILAPPSNASEEQLHTSSEQTRTYSPLQLTKPFLALGWPWSSSNNPSDEDVHHEGANQSISGNHEIELSSDNNSTGLLGLSWPWTPGESAKEDKPNSSNESQPPITGATTLTQENLISTTTPAESLPPPKNTFLSMAWPWSSDKESNDDQEQSKSKTFEGDEKPKAESESGGLVNLKWPWSSPKQITNDDAKTEYRPATTDSKSSKRFSNQIANFAKKALPDKLLAMTPWANKSPKEEEKGSQVEPANLPPPRPPSLLRETLQLGIKPKKSDSKKSPKINENISTSSSVSVIDSQGDTYTLIDDLHLLNIPIPDHLAVSARPKTDTPESNWDNAFHYLANLAGKDDRYKPVNIRIFGEKWDHGDLNSDSSEGSPVPSFMNISKELSSENQRSTPFMYFHRPFRMPKLARLQAEDSGGSTLFTFDPIKVESNEWATIRTGSETYLAAKKWAQPEPIRADKQLLPEVDPLVRYKLQRIGKNRVTPKDLQKTQMELAVGISPSGRKLDGYSSDSEEEYVYRREACKHDPDFDVVQPFLETETGDKWPNPYLFYWNWRKTDEDANEIYLQHQRPDKAHDLIQKRRVALELYNDPLKIPYQNLGAEDTDYEDPLGPLFTTPVRDKFNYLRKSQFNVRDGAAADAFQDPIAQRYPYLLLDQYNSTYRKFYQLQLVCQAQRRRFYGAYRRALGKYTSSCATIASYPIWFYIWKRSIRHWMRNVPRQWKVLDERKAQTVFYGTFASLYSTQYIAEHDLLPNMDDPVHLSQLALEEALEIKEEFLAYLPTGSGSSKPFVDYIKMQRSKKYEKYMERIGLLCRYQPIKMPPRVRKVFFLNYFNVLSIQTQILRIPEKENTTYLWEMKNFWEKTKGLAGFMELSLEEIYHGILRCNRTHPIKQVRVFEEHPVKGFPKEMSPSRLSLDWMDPRVHFALSVGCKSCPPIHTFSLYEQDCQLDEVARTYVRKRVKVNVEFRTITLPILFLWYEKDFGNNQYIMLWYLKQFMLSKDVLKMRQLFTTGKSIRLRYERFDYEIDHIVRRHPTTKCETAFHTKVIPVYWGSKF